ncbi:MAG: DUF86 domain-containing protein [Proteobacteria bacterium]|nr:DUF86 domain-containing protein [Pseudomonadota bacterium]MBU1688936.1 DUF86 domain-containing protein [Pseudomonadota bacterium]
MGKAFWYSEAFLEENSRIDWLKIKGFRNIIAHDYFGVDAEEVWQIARIHLPELAREIHLLLDLE